jgi:hypothetical protein
MIGEKKALLHSKHVMVGFRNLKIENHLKLALL